MPTEPIPIEVDTRDAVGAQLVPYHAVSTSSVEKRCPSRSWKIRKCPLMASSVSSVGAVGGESAPGGMGPGFAQPLKCVSTNPSTPNFQIPTPTS